MKAYASAYLDRIDEVIAKGPYKAAWDSLARYPVPDWFREAKFGIFIHWGIFSVPAFGSEWYARNMYLSDKREYQHHIQTYGSHKDFGYADFIPMFKAEQYDPKQWAQLLKESGARYVMPVAEHHDGFQMYASQVSDWNASRMGPCRDVFGDLKKEVEALGLTFCASSHRAENYWFYAGGRSFDSGICFDGYREPYGYAHPMYARSEHYIGTHNIYSEGPCKEFLDDWLVRTCELVDAYQPKAVYFDWWIQNLAFKPYLKKFAAYYYNRSIEWAHPVVIQYKHDAFVRNTAVFDVERGQLAGVQGRTWQTDTAIATNSWCYTTGNKYKSAEEIIQVLIDTVSKNGNLLLNVGPKSDGTITFEEQHVLREIGKWLAINGEGIYDTQPWATFAEGPFRVEGGYFKEAAAVAYSQKDIRFTYRAPCIYAFVLKWPDSQSISIESLGFASPYMSGHVRHVEILGSEQRVFHKREPNALVVNPSEKFSSPYPVCLKIEIE